MSKRVREAEIDEAPKGKKRRSVAERSLAPVNGRLLLSEEICGVLEEVTLINFMFHERLQFKLGAHVNFIVGKNGSGKSAIMTAIAVALGGKASFVGRGSTVKNFVKHGKNAATVAVKLSNRGSDRYKHAEYGDSIIIERRINRDGGSTYSVKSHTGSVISKKRQEVDNIVSAFNIQQDNPCVMMSQDVSRTFLGGVSDKDKFEFFLQGTQLKQINADHRDTEKQIDRSSIIIEENKRLLKTTKVELDRLLKQYQVSKQLDSLKTQVEDLKKECAWAHVAIAEKEYALSEQKLQKESQNSKCEEKVEMQKVRISENQKEIAQIQEEVKSMSAEISTQKKKRDECEKEKNNIKKEYRSVCMDLKRADNERASYNRERDQIMQRIKDIKESDYSAYEREKQERDAQIQALERQYAELKAESETIKNDKRQYAAAVQSLMQQVAESVRKEKELKFSQAQQNQLISQLNGARKDEVNRYGKSMRHVLKAIDDNATIFHRKPKGPLGSHIKLKDTKWATSVERCLGGLLTSFVCHDHHDEKQLEKILSYHWKDRYKPSIITTRFLNQEHNIAQGRIQHERFSCVYDVISVDDPVVSNCLIDQRGIETILLFEDSKEAREVMSNNPPQRLKEGFTLAGDQLYCRPTYRWYSKPQYFKAKFLTGNIDLDIKEYQDEIEQMQLECSKILQIKKDLQGQIDANRREERRCNVNIDTISRKAAGVDMKLQDLRNREIQAPQDIRVLEEDLESLDMQLKRCENSSLSHRAREAQVKQQLRSSEENFERVDSEIQNVKRALDPFEESLTKKLNEHDQMAHNLKHYERKLKEHNDKMDSLQKSLDERAKSVEMSKAKAERFWQDRINTNRTPSDISSEIFQIEKTIQSETAIRGDMTEILSSYEEKRDKYVNTLKEIKQLEDTIKNCRQGLQTRVAKYSILLKLMASRIGYYFVLLLHQTERFKGRLDFDYDNKKLTINVHTNQNKTNDMKSLSGGEKSFSTVCFVLALWDCIECPFRCLDEFDVYQDMVNRRISLSLIQSYTSSNKLSQFLFLTPQPMQIHSSSSVQIFHLPDPVRSNGKKGPRDDSDSDE